MTSLPQEPEIGQVSDWFEERPINKANRQKLAQMIRDKVVREVRMLDYACGPGFLSNIFGPYVSSIHAVDASSAMIERYRNNMNEFGPGREKIAAIVGNLLLEPPERALLADEEYQNFNLITVGSALHHFPSAEDAVRLLDGRLKPGGVLFIQDLYSHLSSEAVQQSGQVKPPQYKEGEMKKLMEKAGLGDFKFEILQENLEIELPSEEGHDAGLPAPSKPSPRKLFDPFTPKRTYTPTHTEDAIPLAIDSEARQKTLAPASFIADASAPPAPGTPPPPH
ncbi:hypothetical protein J4E82_004768 [Alternaria postmessia]|uniref:uncharacterized protein n=1 Tax=Alternaria postmessia TaxID=1187938 RepID=UPI0022244DD5|nr:uncharacterized protein J4E82_004768 [Alternaria postmessia]KAI5376547.1 hypothetical protein J4E82_004768 [Alternaria postmessia]